MHTSCPSQGPFPTWPSYVFVHLLQPSLQRSSFLGRVGPDPGIGASTLGGLLGSQTWGSGSWGPCLQDCPECLHIGPQRGMKRGEVRDKSEGGGAALIKSSTYLLGFALHILSYPCLLPKCSFRLGSDRSRPVFSSRLHPHS